MRPLRILHVTPYWADAWAYGGIPRVVGAFTRQLAAAGHHVTVCATDACSATARQTGTSPRVIDGVTLRVFPNRSNRLAHDWQAFLPAGLHRYLRDHARDFDVAHLHACRNLPGVIAAHCLTRFGVPYVLAPNGTAPVIERRRIAKRVFDALAGARVMREAAAVIAVSEAERRQLLAAGVTPAAIRLLPNPVDLSEFSQPLERGRFRQRAGFGHEPVVMFLGKVTPRKRLDVLVRAFARLGGRTRLVLAGNDMGGLAEARALVRALGLEARTHYPGLLTGRDRLDALADADVVVYPSEDEVFGLVPLEALLSGTPVIVSGDSGCGEIVSSVGGGCVVPAANEVALASAMDLVLASSQAWRHRAAAAADRVRETFGAAAVTARLVDVYAGVLRPAAIERNVPTGVSYVVPVKNGAATIARTIASIEAQADGRPSEILVIDDRSTDASGLWLAASAAEGRIRLLAGSGRGASAAVNLGIRVATHPVICQIDQDVELLPDWTRRVVSELDRDTGLAAVQGQYTVDPGASLIARAMALDLEQRYIAVEHGETGHVCTGHTAYRAEAVRAAGLFDETIGYGNDNDMSYRLRAAGWRLAHCRQARGFHRWREGLAGYARQQYGFGYGRLDVVARHPGRVAGDSVSPATMMVHPLIMAAAVALLVLSAGLSAVGWPARLPFAAGLALVGMLAAERTVAALRAWWRFGDPAALLFPALHLVRDLAWVGAAGMWITRRMFGRASRPSHSMRERPVTAAGFIPRPIRTIGIIPAHNEAATIAAVVADVRECCAWLDLLVVDDGSTDGSAHVIERAGVRWLQLPERMGVGSAMRAGLRYARRMGYDSAIRLDGDGQHQAADIERLLAPLAEGRADVVMGSRFLAAPAGRPGAIRAAQRALAWGLSVITRRAVTDPTSGFCAVGPRALRLLADQHPTGYAEPEMQLLLSRHGLGVVEVPVESRPRLGGRSSLTAWRLTAAGARVLLAMLIVPLRRAAGGGDGA